MKPKQQKIDDDFKGLINKHKRKQLEKMLQEVRKLESLANQCRQSQDLAEIAELTLQVDRQIETMQRLKKGL